MDFAQELVTLYALGNPRYLNKQVLVRDIYQLLEEFDLEPLEPIFIRTIRKRGNNKKEILEIENVIEFRDLIGLIQQILLIYPEQTVYDLNLLESDYIAEHFAGLDEKVIDYYIDVLEHQ